VKTLRVEGGSIVRFVDAPDPTPEHGEVLVETAVSALCGSELHTYRGKGRPQGNTGHEAAGTVVQLGPGVSGLRVGQRVGVTTFVGCGQCAECAQGRYTWCRNRLPYGRSMHSQYIVTAPHACLPLPDDVPWDVGALISGDGMGVPYHTHTRMNEPSIRRVAVLGLGPIGLGSVLLQAYSGREVIGVDVTPARLSLAEKLGARHLLNAQSEDIVARIRSLTDGDGVDASIEAAGRAETLKQCFKVTRMGGKVLLNGVGYNVELSASDDFIHTEISAIGCWYYHVCEFPAMLALYRQGLPAADLITHRFPASQAAEAYKEFAAGHTGKVLLLWKE
jgi:L-iditol 2-dehydrogenase